MKKELFSHVRGPDFHPNYILSEWDDPTSTSKNISAAIWLPSDVHPDDYKFHMSSYGVGLHLNVLLPLVVTDTIVLHKLWLSKAEHRCRIKSYHLKISGF